MSRLEKLFRYINEYNKYATAYYVNEDNNYYYFKINKGYTTEIPKDRLNELSDIKLIFEAKDILNNYQARFLHLIYKYMKKIKNITKIIKKGAVKNEV